MIPLFTNNASTTLAANVSAIPATGSITLTVAPGKGALFPSPTSGYYFPVTCVNSSGQREVFACTSRSVDTLTVTRAQESTTALAFNTGDSISLRMTAGSLSDLLLNLLPTYAVPLSNVAGTNTITADFPSGITVLTINKVYYFISAGANTGAVTLNIGGTGAKNIYDITTPLVSGDIPAAGRLIKVVYDGTNFQIIRTFTEVPVYDLGSV